MKPDYCLRSIEALFQNIRFNLDQNMNSWLKQIVEPWSSCDRIVFTRTTLILQTNVMAWKQLAARTEFSVKLTGKS
jgi:hypothetical protein